MHLVQCTLLFGNIYVHCATKYNWIVIYFFEILTSALPNDGVLFGAISWWNHSFGMHSGCSFPLQENFDHVQ